jgi:hypothetical protein
MDATTKQGIIEAVRAMCKTKAGAGALLVTDAVEEVLTSLREGDAELWNAMKEDFASVGVGRFVERILVKALAAAGIGRRLERRINHFRIMKSPALCCGHDTLHNLCR